MMRYACGHMIPHHMQNEQGVDLQDRNCPRCQRNAVIGMRGPVDDCPFVYAPGEEPPQTNCPHCNDPNCLPDWDGADDDSRDPPVMIWGCQSQAPGAAL